YMQAYHRNMAEGKTSAAKNSARDLGLFLGEVRVAAQNSLPEQTKEEQYNFLAGTLSLSAKRLVDLVPGGNLAADVAKDLLQEASNHWIERASKFPQTRDKQLDELVKTFGTEMFEMSKDTYWSLRDPHDLRKSVRTSPELERLKAEYEEFVSQFE